MIFCHIVDDYYLQGWLASAKQKAYWQQNAPFPLYKYDYIWALLVHSFSWSFVVMFPIFYFLSFEISSIVLITFIGNIILHALTDNLKANEFKINLWIDQLVHMCQIVTTWLMFTGGVFS